MNYCPKHNNHHHCHRSFIPGVHLLHSFLHDSYEWYRKWHHYRFRPQLHLLIFISTLLIAIGLILQALQPSNIPARAATGILQEFPFQGRLTNADGTVISNGSYDVVFKLYNVVDEVTADWTESHTAGNQITTTNGIFNTMLGSITSLGSIDFNTDTWYLGITVGADAEMTPRIRLGAAPYAFNSEQVGGKQETSFALLAGRSGGQTVIGGTAVTDDLSLQTTSGVGTTGADMHFKVGNNGATEAMTILNSGNVGIGTTGPGSTLEVAGGITVKKTSTGIQSIFHDYYGGARGALVTRNDADSVDSRGSGLGIQSGAGVLKAQVLGVSEDSSRDAYSLVFSTTTAGGSVATAMRLWGNGGLSLGSYTGSNPATGNIITSGNIGVGYADPGTAKLAINAAMTGHLVLSTFHAIDAPTVLTRLLDMGIEPFLIASTINIAIAQRLVRKICPSCIESYEVSFPELEKLFGRDLASKLPQTEEKKIRLFRGKGCPLCQNTGYLGRIGIFEILEMTDSIKNLVLEKAPAGKIKEETIKLEGMKTMIEDGLRKVEMGITTLDEILKAVK